MVWDWEDNTRAVDGNSSNDTVVSSSNNNHTDGFTKNFIIVVNDKDTDDVFTDSDTEKGEFVHNNNTYINTDTDINQETVVLSDDPDNTVILINDYDNYFEIDSYGIEDSLEVIDEDEYSIIFMPDNLFALPNGIDVLDNLSVIFDLFDNNTNIDDIANNIVICNNEEDNGVSYANIIFCKMSDNKDDNDIIVKRNNSLFLYLINLVNYLNFLTVWMY